MRPTPLRSRVAARSIPLVSLLFVLASPAAAGSAAAGDAAVSFERFTRHRVTALRARSERARLRPVVRPGPEVPVIIYRAAGNHFETELSSTGQPAAPWVGSLHYTEHVYSCEDAAAKKCVQVTSHPVTEIYRYRNGTWGH